MAASMPGNRLLPHLHCQAHGLLDIHMEHRTRHWDIQDTSLLKASNNDSCIQQRQRGWGHAPTADACFQNTSCRLGSSKVLTSTSLQSQLGAEKQAVMLFHAAHGAQQIFSLCLTWRKALFDCIRPPLLPPGKQVPQSTPTCRCGKDALSSTQLQWNKLLLQDCWDKP